jgi:hypothetical protein
LFSTGLSALISSCRWEGIWNSAVEEFHLLIIYLAFFGKQFEFGRSTNLDSPDWNQTCPVFTRLQIAWSGSVFRIVNLGR